MDEVFWGIFGWCGSVPLSVLIAWLIRHHHGPVPGPGPDPDPVYRPSDLLIRVLGAAAGVAGGYLAARVLTVPDTAPALNAVTGLAAFASGFLVADLAGFVTARTPAASGNVAAAGIR